MIRRFFRICSLRIALGTAATLSLPTINYAEAAELPEYELKAAFIYNFAKFITWPPDSFEAANSPIIIAVLGENPFGSTLQETLVGKSVGGHPIHIIHFATDDVITRCHILFVARSEKDRLISTLERVAGRPVLTVGDFDRFAHRGGMINLFIEDKAIRFEINANATEQAGFKVSSKLGGLGVIVRGEVVKGGSA